MDINGMSNRMYFLPDHVDFYSTNSSESLAEDLSQGIGEILKQSIASDGRASLAVSGGRTPIPLFDALSDLSLDWSSVDLTLVDDRWVDPSHKDSNEMLVRSHLISISLLSL